MNARRIEIIEDVLIHHRHQGHGVCLCGHVTQLGASLKRHPAEVIDMALAFEEEHA